MATQIRHAIIWTALGAAAAFLAVASMAGVTIPIPG